MVSRWTPHGFKCGHHMVSTGHNIVSTWTPCGVQETTWKPAEKRALHETNCLPCFLFNSSEKPNYIILFLLLTSDSSQTVDTFARLETKTIPQSSFDLFDTKENCLWRNHLSSNHVTLHMVYIRPNQPWGAKA